MTRPQAAFLGILFLAGIVHWVLFLRAGDSFFCSGDWAKEYKYYAVLQEAVQTGRMPYHVSFPLSLMATQRFMAIPEALSVFWPPVLLLAFLDIQAFILANILILFSIGFAGCLLVRNRYCLSPFVFFMLFALFNFNGYITAHLAAGHSMWTGYFFLPWTAFFLLKILEAQAGWNSALWLAVSLLGMVLQGAFHMFIWCLMFLALVLIWRVDFRARLQILAAILLGLFLSAMRLWPALLSGNVSRGIEAGYNSWRVFLNALILIRPWSLELTPGIFYWEYDYYIGIAGLIFILFYGVVLRFARDERLAAVRYPGLDLALLVMPALAAGAVYRRLAAQIPIALLAVERVPSRFLVLPFIFLLALACIRAQRVIRPAAMKPAPAFLLLIAAAVTAGCLALHSFAWRAAVVKPFDDTQLTTPLIVNIPDAPYLRSLHFSAGVSLAAGLGLAVLMLSRRKRNRPC